MAFSIFTKVSQKVYDVKDYPSLKIQIAKSRPDGEYDIIIDSETKKVIKTKDNLIIKEIYINGVIRLSDCNNNQNQTLAKIMKTANGIDLKYFSSARLTEIYCSPKCPRLFLVTDTRKAYLYDENGQTYILNENDQFEKRLSSFKCLPDGSVTVILYRYGEAQHCLFYADKETTTEELLQPLVTKAAMIYDLGDKIKRDVYHICEMEMETTKHKFTIAIFKTRTLLEGYTDLKLIKRDDKSELLYALNGETTGCFIQIFNDGTTNVCQLNEGEKAVNPKENFPFVVYEPAVGTQGTTKKTTRKRETPTETKRGMHCLKKDPTTGKYYLEQNYIECKYKSITVGTEAGVIIRETENGAEVSRLASHEVMRCKAAQAFHNILIVKREDDLYDIYEIHGDEEHMNKIKEGLLYATSASNFGGEEELITYVENSSPSTVKSIILR